MPALVPEFEPEVILAFAKGGDTEKLATTTLESIDFRGVTLRSRYQKALEYRTMAAMVDGISDDLVSLVSEVFCDSKADAYTVSLKACNKGQAEQIGRQIEIGAADYSYSWLSIQGERGGRLDLDGNWAGFEEPS